MRSSGAAQEQAYDALRIEQGSYSDSKRSMIILH